MTKWGIGNINIFINPTSKPCLHYHMDQFSLKNTNTQKWAKVGEIKVKVGLIGANIMHHKGHRPRFESRAASIIIIL